MTEPQPSGVDLARAALVAARAAAKTRPTQPQQKRRTTQRASSRQRLGDPMSFGAAINRLMTERGWEPPEQGSILDQWPTIAPELDGKVTAVRYEHDTGTLHLQPVSPAYATQLRLHQTQVLARVQQAPAGRSVRTLRILPAGAAPVTSAAQQEDTGGRPAEAGPVRTRDTAPAGYRTALTAALEHRPEPQRVDPYIERAMRRQEAALRANRPHEDDREVLPLQQERGVPAPGSMAASERAAIARKRQEQAGLAAPRRLSGAA
ncbi:DciA family protein [Streptomyces sp. MB22_4]|uniref:DciA family protein n=1 Tax=Streptomyces sp. MB22_4 TaxID=3383120 RepID=UPI00399F6C76